MTSDKLGANAVSTAKIADKAVTTAKLADQSVTAAKMELVDGSSSFQSALVAKFTVNDGRLIKRGGVCMAYCQITAKAAIANATVIGSMPSGFIPKMPIVFVPYSTIGQTKTLRCGSSGNIQASLAWNSGDSAYLCCTYLAA